MEQLYKKRSSHQGPEPACLGLPPVGSLWTVDEVKLGEA